LFSVAVVVVAVVALLLLLLLLIMVLSLLLLLLVLSPMQVLPLMRCCCWLMKYHVVRCGCRCRCSRGSSLAVPGVAGGGDCRGAAKCLTPSPLPSVVVCWRQARCRAVSLAARFVVLAADGDGATSPAAVRCRLAAVPLLLLLLLLLLLMMMMMVMKLCWLMAARAVAHAGPSLAVLLMKMHLLRALLLLLPR
jgi:hypothetical protein